MFKVNVCPAIVCVLVMLLSPLFAGLLYALSIDITIQTSIYRVKRIITILLDVHFPG